jgi:CBS-domain-containing membrane protein
MSIDQAVRPQTDDEAAAAPTVPRRLAGRAPTPPPPGATLHAFSAATAGLLALAGIGTVFHDPVLIPPLAASAALIHSAPTTPIAQPRSVVGGHLLSALVGYAVVLTFGGSTWAAALAAGLSLGVMMIARKPHSPACATAVIVVLQDPHPLRFLTSLVGATMLLVLAGFAASRSRRGAPAYPVYWW